MSVTLAGNQNVDVSLSKEHVYGPIMNFIHGTGTKVKILNMSKALATKNVAAVLLAVAMVFSFAFAFATPAKADATSDLQAQVTALLAQIQALQGTTSSNAACVNFTFTSNLAKGKTSAEVMQIQKFLNQWADTTVSTSGAGSKGNETSYFGAATKSAVIKFQNKYAADILTPNGLSAGNGNWYASTRAKANAIAATCVPGSTTGGTTGGTTTGGNLVVTAGTQPANSLAPVNATRVPFTTFTLTNSSNAAVTVNGVTVQRTGLANDAVFAGVILVDSNGIQYGNAQTFNSNHQATVGGTFTIGAGQSMTFTVAGNMETSSQNYGGQVASLAVVGINTASTVSGSLPITGAAQTVNETLSIGTASVQRSSFDPNGSRSIAIGTTGTIFGGIRVTANTEDQKLFSITWNQTGSAGSTDLSNLKTVVNGVSYPVTVDASGKYYTSTFPGGLLVTKGNSIDAYVQGDVTGGNASGRTVEFDIYRSSDIYLVGQTYGYGIAPTSAGGGSYSANNNSSSGFLTSGNPFYFGATVTVTGGTLSTISTASSIAPHNVAVNVTGQVLGGFSTNFTGEPVTVQSLRVDVATSSGATQLTNVTLVDQNNLVVAGPVDSVYLAPGSSKITFNSSITFPTGAMTYTVKGTVASGATNGATYTLSTNPANWTSAVGQTSGTYVTLPTTTITMSTMTVQPGQLLISAASTPASTTITPNQNNYTIANIVLNATQSGEDVRLNSLPIVVNSTSTVSDTASATNLKAQLTNCQLFQNGVALNSQSVGSSQWTVVNTSGSTYGVEANFIFTSPITVAQGTTANLALQCNIGGSLWNGETFSAGVAAGFAPTVTGATSGNTIVPTVTTSTSGTMTTGTASLAATVPTPISYAQAAGGTTAVKVGTFTLQPASGSVNLSNVALRLNSNMASSSDIANGQVAIYQGSTVVGTVSFNGVAPVGGYYTATTTISNVNLAQNAQTAFDIKADISQIGLGNAGTSGHEIRVSLANAQGTSGNAQVNSGTPSAPATGVAIFKTYPTQVTLTALTSGGVADGKLIGFSVTNNGQNATSLGLTQMVFTFSSSTGVTITTPTLYAYIDAGFSNPAGGTTNGIAGLTSYSVANQTATTTISSPLEIPAGATWYFLLKASSVSYSGAGTTYNIATTLKGDSSDNAPVMLASATLAAANNAFIWSPNSNTTSATTDADWTNGYGVNGLPSIGLTQNRTQ